MNMAIEEIGTSVPQFGLHPVEQKIAHQITTEMKTMEMKLWKKLNFCFEKVTVVVFQH